MLPSMAAIHFVSDSTNNQYRFRTVVHLIGKFPALCNGIQATSCRLEGGHGKGPCDGVGGRLKKRADNLLTGGAVMRNISEFVTVIELSGLKSELITITPPDVEEVQEMISTWPIVAVKGLMATHALVPNGDDLYIRTEACYKECCYAGAQGEFTLECKVWEKVPKKSDKKQTKKKNTKKQENEAESSEEKYSPPVRKIKKKGDSDEEYIPPTTKSKSNVESTEEKPKRRRARKSNNAVKVESDDDKNGDSNSNDDGIPLAQLKASKKHIVVVDDEDDEDDGIPLAQLKAPENQAAIDTIKQLVDVEEGDYIAVMYGYRWYPVRVTKVQGETVHIVYMKPVKGVWKWGEPDNGTVERAAILMKISSPIQKGKVWHFKPEEVKKIKNICKILNTSN